MRFPVGRAVRKSRRFQETITNSDPHGWPKPREVGGVGEVMGHCVHKVTGRPLVLVMWDGVDSNGAPYCTFEYDHDYSDIELLP